MQRRTWYKIALFLPIMVPLLIGEVKHFGHLRSESLGVFPVFLLMSILFAGAQYICFSIGVLLWFRRKTLEQIQRLSWLLPVLFVPVCIFPFALLKFNATLSNFGSLLSLSGVTFSIGLFYVLLAHGLTWAFEKAGWIKD